MNIYSRELEIVDFADNHTRQILMHQTQQALIVLSVNSYSHWGRIITDIEQSNLHFLKFRSVTVTDILIDEIAEELEDRHVMEILPSNSVSLVLLVRGEAVFSKMETLKQTVFKSFRSEIITSSNERNTSSLVELIFGSSRISTATFDSCTCCIIKPHALKEKVCGAVLDMITRSGFEISAVDLLHFDRSKAEEFLEVYKGVVPEYADQVTQLCGGPCLALELRGQEAVAMLRRLAGPWDVDIAKELYPESIRGSYGSDKVRCVVHCTDMEEDAQLECHYCFRLML